MTNKFIDFLVQHNALDEYDKNNKSKNPYDYFGAFKWERTSEGYNYWWNLDFLWHKTLNQKESKIEKRKICIYQYCLQNGNDFNSGFLEAPAIKSSTEAAQLRTIICENLKLNEKNYTLISLNIIGEKDE